MAGRRARERAGSGLNIGCDNRCLYDLPPQTYWRCTGVSPRLPLLVCR